MKYFRTKKKKKDASIIPESSTALVCIELRTVRLPRTSRGFTTAPQVEIIDSHTTINILSVYKLNIFLLAFTRAGFNSQLTLNCQGPKLSRYGHIRLSVEHIKTIREYFQPDKKARVLERACIVANKGAKGPIFDGDMPP
jgi:hypothetical protein